MKFIHDFVPDINIVNDGEFLFEIKSVQNLDEQEDKVILKCAEYIEKFKRGFICDLVCHYHTADENEENKENYSDVIRDLVLVHINKSWDIESFTQFEYVFYK